MSVRRAIHGFAFFGIILATAGHASAGPITGRYVVESHMLSYSSGSDFLSLWSHNQITPGQAANAPINLGFFRHDKPNPNFYPMGQTPVVRYDNVGFEITIKPEITPPPTLPGGYSSHYEVTGPAFDGVVLHGVVNGTVDLYGTSSLVATFKSATPYDMKDLLALYPNVSYLVDPSLSNPFPIDLLNLRGETPINLGGWTDINVTVVPEPATIVLFLPLAALAARKRARHPSHNV